uniref:Uncharacterized protein n=1 Tax=Trichuris muris TaxID=70415 RepID=A0A5S6QZR8_TRIMR
MMPSKGYPVDAVGVVPGDSHHKRGERQPTAGILFYYIFYFHTRGTYGSRWSATASAEAQASSDQLGRLPSARWDERVG